MSSGNQEKADKMAFNSVDFLGLDNLGNLAYYS
jgi:hypothetical protein